MDPQPTKPGQHNSTITTEKPNKTTATATTENEQKSPTEKSTNSQKGKLARARTTALSREKVPGLSRISQKRKLTGATECLIEMTGNKK